MGLREASGWTGGVLWRMTVLPGGGRDPLGRLCFGETGEETAPFRC